MRDQFSELAKKYAPWSMSKVKLAKNCPFAFNCNYVQKFVQKTASKSQVANIGVAVHEILEEFLRGMDIREAFQRSIVNNKLTTPEAEEVGGYLHNIIQFKKRLDKFKKKHNVRAMHIEEEFGFDIDLNGVDYWAREEDKKDENGHVPYKVFFRGKWDLVLETDDGHIIIIDHKSGEAKSDKTEALARYDDQRRFYAIGALTKYPQMRGVKTAFHYVMSEEILWVKGMDTPDSIRNKFVPWYVDLVNTSAAEIPSNRTGKKDWYCNFCSYTHLCPVHSR